MCSLKTDVSQNYSAHALHSSFMSDAAASLTRTACTSGKKRPDQQPHMHIHPMTLKSLGLKGVSAADVQHLP